MQNIVDICKIKCIMRINKQYWERRMRVKNLKLKLARMEKDLSQIDLAKRVGVTRQTIGMIEAGDYNPTLNLCIAICKELGKTLDEIFWEGNENV